jgi:hypothetical protein
MKKPIVLDCEVYPDYFLAKFQSPNGAEKSYTLTANTPLDKTGLAQLMRSRQTVGFNSRSFDLYLIAAAIIGYSNARLKALCDELIDGQSWRVAKAHKLYIPDDWDHIDLIEVAPGQASLKIYAGRLQAKRMQELPYSPHSSTTPAMRDEISAYCSNDLTCTRLLLDALTPQIELRESMSEQYGVDLRSKSDAQIAESVIVSELEAMTGQSYERPTIAPGTAYRYKLPAFISYSTPLMQSVLDTVCNALFVVADSGSITMPEELSALQISIGQSRYSLGIGGLHSCEKRAAHHADDNTLLCDFDFASYYPFIILGQELFPQHLGRDFLTVYRSIVMRRIEAKNSGDKVTADSLKITINGSFGKLGSKYSMLYSPDLMIQTTISGQLVLLMLIERLELAGISVISANTDGIVLKIPACLYDSALDIIAGIELETGFDMEETRYKAIYSESVNNYIAVKTDGKTKGKGVYAGGSLSKNPDMPVCVDAVHAYLSKGVPVETTINECTSPAAFCVVRAVTGGATKDGQPIGKALRFYYSADTLTAIHYAKNGNKVPSSDGALPLMELPDSTSAMTIDFSRYIKEANTMLANLAATQPQQKQKDLF